MSTFFIILIILVAILLIVVILIQNPKGGGLSSNFTSSSQVSDVRRTTDVLEKGTYLFAGLLMALCLIYNIVFQGNEKVKQESALKGQAIPTQQAPAPAITPQQNQPVAPAPAN